MNRERLNHLKTVMLRVAESAAKLDMSTWASDTNTITEEGEHICGTSCCAFGYAALDPVFQKQGLKLLMQTNYNEWSGVDTAERLSELMQEGHSRAEVFFGNDKSFVAADAFFGLTDSQFGNFKGWNAADYLFASSAYGKYTREITPADVIAHIDEVLALGEGMTQSTQETTDGH